MKDAFWPLEWSQFLVLLLTTGVVSIGMTLRIVPLIEIGVPPDYPVGGGGLFYAFVEAIQTQGFAYPKTIPNYKVSGIPFSYPPLIPYLISVTVAFTPLSAFGLLQTLPFVFAALTVPAIALVSYEFLDLNGALVATAVYALSPGAFNPFLAGEGLIEAASTLAFIICLFLLWRLSTTPPTRRKEAILGIAIGVAVMIGPGSLAAVPVTALAFVLVFSRSVERFRSFIIAGVISIGVACLWLVPVLIHHGPDVFISAWLMKTEGTTTLAEVGNTAALRPPEFAQSPANTLPITLLLAAGMLYSVVSDHRFLPFVLIMPILEKLGEPGYIVWIPLAILISIGATRALPMLLTPWFNQAHDTLADALPRTTLLTVVMTAMIVAVILTPALSIASGVPLSEQSVKEQENTRNALMWVENHSSPDSTVLIITTDFHLLDWAPVWANRPIINVYQGGEWTGDHDRIKHFNRQLSAAETPQDVINLAGNHGIRTDYDYVVITSTESHPELSTNYSASPIYEEVILINGTAVFKNTTN